MLIAEQIERAQAAAGSSNDDEQSTAAEGLKRDEGAEKVVLSFSAKPAVAPAPAVADPSSSTSISASSSAPPPPPPPSGLSLGSGLKLNGHALKPVAVANPLKANPLKRPNVFKTAAPAASSSSASGSGSDKSNERKRPLSEMSAAERLIIEDQERKRRKMEREAAS
jgi:DNA/RNA-binding protein KIN17